MRMWMVPPVILCRRHLLGEHVELHMIAGALCKGKSLRGFIDKGLIELDQLHCRHAAIADEMVRRGYSHKSPLKQTNIVTGGRVDKTKSVVDLRARCPECTQRIERYREEAFWAEFRRRVWLDEEEEE